MKSNRAIAFCLLWFIIIFSLAPHLMANEKTAQTLKAGDIFYAKKDYAKAIEAYKESLETSTSEKIRLYTFNQLGNSYHFMKKYGAAIANYNESLKIKKFDSLVLSSLARSYFANNQTPKAIEAANRSKKINKKNVHAWNALGMAYEKQGKTIEAIGAYEEALPYLKSQGKTDTSNILSNFANSYLKNGQVDEAIAAAKKAIEYNPKNAAGFNALGMAYEKKEDFTKAIEAYGESADINPQALYLANLGDAYYQNGKFKAAVSTYKRSRKIDKDQETRFLAQAIYKNRNPGQSGWVERVFDYVSRLFGGN